MNKPADLAATYALIRAAVAQARGLAPDAPLHERVALYAHCARLFAEQGAASSAEAYFEQALVWADWLAAVDSSVELLCEMAEAVADAARHQRDQPREKRNAARRRALAYADRAAELAPRLACPAVEARVLCRISNLLERCGRSEDARALRVRAQWLAEPVLP